MKVYIHERADETTLILSYEGQVLGVYSSVEDAHVGYRDDTGSDEKIFYNQDMLELDSAA